MVTEAERADHKEPNGVCRSILIENEIPEIKGESVEGDRLTRSQLAPNW